MKQFFGSLALIFLWMIFGIHVGVSAPPGVPKIIFHEKSHEFKEVKEGVAIQHTFRVFNKGESPLNIDRVSPG
jgi:hypothetical protein